MKKANSNISLGLEQLGILFPFYFLIDKDLKVCNAGASIRKLVPRIRSANFNSLFTFDQQAKSPITFGKLCQMEQKTIKLRGKKNKAVMLKGQFLCFPEVKKVLFVGSPLVTNKRELEKLNLNTNDFSIHNTTTDMLNVLQARESIMNEVKSLATDLQKQTEKLHTSSDRLSSLILNLQSGILLENENREIVLANKEFCSLFGMNIDPAHLIGVDCSSSASQVKHLFIDANGFESKVNNLVKKRKKCLGEIIHMKNGMVLQRDFIPVIRQKKYLGHLWIYTNITQKANSEKVLRQNEEKYRQVIENFGLGLLEVDLQGNIVKSYAGFSKMTGFSEKELLGKNALFLMANKDDLPLIKRETEKRKNGKPGLYELQIKTKSRKVIWVLISGAPIYDENNKVVGSIGIHKDITAQKKREINYLRAKEIAEESTNLKKQLLANVSHEVRTPIHAIKGLTETLLHTKLDADQMEDLNSIHYSANHLLSIVQDLLDIAKMESGKTNLVKQSFNLKDALLKVAHNYHHLVLQKNLAFNFKLDPKIPVNVFGDEIKLIQVLTNLLNNAIKFTHEGKIDFAVFLKETRKEKDILVFMIQDTGIGMAPDKIYKAFESFVQVSSDDSHQYGGTGLGLAITKRIIELMKGKINVKSQLGEGTRFTIELPFLADREEKAIAVPYSDVNLKSSLSPIKVLVAEDNTINQLVLKRQLANLKIQPEFVSNGKELVDELQNDFYDLVLMDLQMPVLDGYEATKAIRSMSDDYYRNIKIVGMSAHASGVEKTRALNCGMNDFLEKPFTETELTSKISSAFKTVRIPQQLNANEIDFGYLHSIGGSNTEFIKEVIGVYFKNVPLLMAELQEACYGKKSDHIVFICHKLKGSIKMFGYSQLVERLQNMEKHAAKKDETFDYKGNCAFICEEIKQLNEELITKSTQL